LIQYGKYDNIKAWIKQLWWEAEIVFLFERGVERGSTCVKITLTPFTPKNSEKEYE